MTVRKLMYRLLKNYQTNFRRKKIINSLSVGCGVSALALVPLVKDKETFKSQIVNAEGIKRFLSSLRIGLCISIDYYFSQMGLVEGSPNYKVMIGRIHQRAADRLLNGCLTNGGSYIKLGQGLVSMNQIIPAEYVNTLKALQDKCLPRKKNELIDLFQQDLGKNPDEVFEEFQSEPIAAASIAQVFKAKTKDNKEVAIKVQYIDLQERFESDVWTINLLLKMIGIMHPSFNFDWVLVDLKKALAQELDFVNEGKNAERCAKDLQHLSYIHVPEVYWEYTSTRILVTEFIDGYKINDIAALTKDGYSLSDINKKLFEAFGHQIFHTGFVHADPHPGNVLIRKKNGSAELVLLDHGLYQEVLEKDRIALSGMWKSIVLKDHAKMKKYANELGVQNHDVLAEILTQAPLKTHGFRLRQKLSEEDLQHMTDFARERFEIIMDCLKEMPSSLLLVIRNLNTIRAIAHDHGNPIDRYTVLARMASKTALLQGSGYFQPAVKLYFEFMLLVHKLRRIITERLMGIFYKLGMSPDPNIFNQQMVLA